MGLIFKPIIGIALNGGILYILTQIVEGMKYTGGIKFFVIGGIILGIFNFLIKPLIKLIALPLVFITGGLVLIALNIFILWFLKYFLSVIQFQDISLSFPNLKSYFIGAIILGAINWIIQLFIK